MGFGVSPSLGKEEMGAPVIIPMRSTLYFSPGQGKWRCNGDFFRAQPKRTITVGSIFGGLQSLCTPAPSPPPPRSWAHTHAFSGLSEESPLFGPPRWGSAAVEPGPQQGARVPGGQTSAHKPLEPATRSGAALETCIPHLQSPPPPRDPLELQGQRRECGRAMCGPCDPSGGAGHVH